MQRASLRICFKGNEQRRASLSGRKQIVGRDPTCDIVIDNLSVSNQHCQLIQADSTHWLQDLRSSNGTFVNGERVEQRCLRHMDEIGVGKFILIYDNDQAKNSGSGNLPPEIMSGVDADEPREASNTYAIDAGQLEKYMHQVRKGGNESTASGVYSNQKPEAPKVESDLLLLIIVGLALLVVVLGLLYVAIVLM